jgi:hypothetical protein
MMNESSLSSSALEVLAILRSSKVFRPLIEEHPDLLALFIQAADSTTTAADRERLIGAVTRATAAGDKCIEALCSGGNVVDLTELNLTADRASEELGQILKKLVPSAVPITIDASAAPS